VKNLINKPEDVAKEELESMTLTYSGMVKVHCLDPIGHCIFPSIDIYFAAGPTCAIH
jgi:hypothetical protein